MGGADRVSGRVGPAPGVVTRFRPGQLLAHRHFTHKDLVWVPLVRVISDDERGLLLWLARTGINRIFSRLAGAALVVSVITLVGTSVSPSVTSAFQGWLFLPSGLFLRSTVPSMVGVENVMLSPLVARLVAGMPNFTR